MNSELIDSYWTQVKVGDTVGVMSMEFENSVQRLLHDNQHSGRSIEAQIAVENTIKMLAHMHSDLSAFHFSDGAP